MNEIANANAHDISTIETLSARAQVLSSTIYMNMWELARVLIEAKELVPHGEWQAWVEKNANMSDRTAQNLMASYKRFGGQAQFESLRPSQVFKMLPLPDGTEEKFMQDHDVQNMTAREIEEEVKKAREEARAKVEAAERRAKAAELNADQAAVKAAEQYAADKRRMEQEIEDQEQTIREQQEDYNRLQAEYLNAQSAAARGDAERAVSDTVTADSLAAAVRSFMGAAARVPYMADTFSTMPPEERRAFSASIGTIEGWAHAAKKALNTIQGEVVHVG